MRTLLDQAREQNDGERQDDLEDAVDVAADDGTQDQRAGKDQVAADREEVREEVAHAGFHRSSGELLVHEFFAREQHQLGVRVVLHRHTHAHRVRLVPISNDVHIAGREAYLLPHDSPANGEAEHDQGEERHVVQ